MARFSENKLLNTKCVLIFSTNFVWNISIWENSPRYGHKSTLYFTSRTRYSCRILMGLKFAQKSFRTNLNYQVSWKSGRVIPCERTDGRTNMKKLIVAFRILTNVTKCINHSLYYTPCTAELTTYLLRCILGIIQVLFSSNA